MRAQGLIGVALALLSGACTQSLFGDGGLDTIDGDGPPCEGAGSGNMACDFNGAQGGLSGSWRYVDDPRDRTWAVMSPGSAAGLEGMVGAGAVPAVIASCLTHTDHALCANDLERLLFLPGRKPEGEPDAAVELAVTASGRFHVTGAALGAQPDGDQELRLYRNTREDLLLVTPLGTSDSAFDLTVDVIAGDRLLFAVTQEENVAPSPVAVGANFADAGSDCPLALNFEDIVTATVPENCAGRDYTGRKWNDVLSDYEDFIPVIIASVIPELGQAVQLGDAGGENEYIRSPIGAEPLDYSSSVTVQFWVSFPTGQYPGFSGTSTFSDFDDATDKGIDILIDPSGEAITYDPIWNVSTQLPDFGWHHFRYVRDAANSRVYMCLDGQRVALENLTITDQTSNQLPWLGRLPGGQAQFNGALDDVRVSYEALPCEIP